MQEYNGIDGIYSFTINISEEKNAILKEIKKVCFDNNGIIFGGMPRDEIIQGYYADLFDKYANDNNLIDPIEYSKNYWNPKIHNESVARMLIVDKAELFFYTYKSSLDFINDMYKIFTKKEFIVNTKCTESLYSGTVLESRIILKNFKIRYYAGKTRTFSGHFISVDIDIVYPRGFDTINIEPPFGNSDLMCNIFVQGKDNNYRVSNNAGEWYKKLSSIKKTLVTYNIMKKMIKFNTDIIKINSKTHYHLSYIERYIYMMVNYKFPWTINNLPYNILPTHNFTNNELCCICNKQLNDCYINNCSIAVINNNNNCSKTHHICLLAIFENQIIYNKYHNTFDYKFSLNNYVKCPNNNIINFNNCYKNIDWNSYLE